MPRPETHSDSGDEDVTGPGIPRPKFATGASGQREMGQGACLGQPSAGPGVRDSSLPEAAEAAAEPFRVAQAERPRPQASPQVGFSSRAKRPGHEAPERPWGCVLPLPTQGSPVGGR